MFLVDTLILIGGFLLLLGIASSKFSARLGVPVLVLFLTLGMLAGSEGILGLEFENYPLAHGIGTLALAMILFDGGLRTPRGAIRIAWKPSILLATLGVAVTATVTGLAAAWILGIPLLEGLLLGSIVGSTDAAAVFAVLRSGGVHLRQRLAATLEIESGSNDPMAIFLTVGLIEVLTGRMVLGPGLLMLFATQMLAGAVVGLAVGFAAVWVVNRINLDAAGLYPVLVTSCSLLTFGLAASLGGSGFLAVYLAGIVIGNSRIVFRRGVFLFHDAVAWLSQIVMFIMLGLLSFPSRLVGVTGQGLLIAAVLILVARPIATLLIFPFRFSWRELLFISWVGLKGAVPITLATFPLLFGLDGAALLFDVVFFVVLVSALIQGWTLPYMARALGLEIPPRPQPPVTLELSSLRHVEGDIVDYLVDDDSPAAGRLVKQLALPEGAVIAIIARQQQIIPPHGNTRVEAGDHVILVLRPGTRPLVNKIFARRDTPHEELPPSLEFPLRGTTRVGELEKFYDIRMDAPPDSTLDRTLRDRLGPQGTVVGARIEFGPIALSVRKLAPDGTIQSVGMTILPQEEVDAAASEHDGETQ
jgi:potassium/hydrogen antiporter